MYTNNQFHTSQVTIATESKRVVNKASLAIFSTGIGLCVACLIPSHWVSKTALISASCGLFYVSHRLDRLKASLAPYEVTAHIQSQQSYSQWLSTSFAPPKREIAIASPIEAPAPVVLSDIKKALSKPHILVLGETGSGKSTLVKFLVSHAAAPSIVLDSHAAPDDWQGMNVIGMGRNYRAIGEAVSQLVGFMDARYQARSQGQKQFEPLLVLIDEFPAAAANLGKAFTDNIMLLVREARKVSIRLIILSQGSEVKTLGIEGQGSIRECFAIVAIGKFATDRAKALKDEPIKQFIESAQYPAMLDDLPCELPKIDRVSLPSLPLPSDYQELFSNAQQIPIAPPVSSITTQPQSQALAPVFQKIVNYLSGKDWKKDYEIKAGIREFKDANTPLPELQGYLQFLELQGYLETRSTGKGNLEAKTLDSP